ncbi:MAG TPA: NAD-dependent epimerase/dehydratase family protein [Gemmatimonadales bacterium]|nr:NAD-dependent epimerase/dehydratase family protein [Gemmatimonadales bacterium]
MGAAPCLVTGGAGFIGSHVAEELVKRGHPVRVVDNLSTGTEANLSHLRGDLELVIGDLRDPAVCRSVCAGMELVFHLAALPSVPRSMADPWASHDHNVNGTVQLLLASREAGVRRMVYSSSSSVYGDTAVLPKVESVEPLPRSPYAAAKLAGEQCVLAYARAGILEGVALRYFNVFGPRQRPDSAYAAVIPLFFHAALSGTPAQVNGDGGQTRDFTYIENVVGANLLASRAPAADGWPINVGAGERTSLLELLEQIRKVTGVPIRIEHQAPRPGDVRDSLADLSRGGELLGYRPSVSLGEGLKRTWEWFRETSQVQ